MTESKFEPIVERITQDGFDFIFTINKPPHLMLKLPDSLELTRRRPRSDRNADEGAASELQRMKDNSRRLSGKRSKNT